MGYGVALQAPLPQDLDVGCLISKLAVFAFRCYVL